MRTGGCASGKLHPLYSARGTALVDTTLRSGANRASKLDFRSYAACWTALNRVFMTFREPWPCRPSDKTCSRTLSQRKVLSMSANDAQLASVPRSVGRSVVMMTFRREPQHDQSSRACRHNVAIPRRVLLEEMWATIACALTQACRSPAASKAHGVSPVLILQTVQT
jgi:hypothetical protein